jgi:hypothetical protein
MGETPSTETSTSAPSTGTVTADAAPETAWNRARVGFERRLLILLWKRLNLFTILCIVLMLHASFWLLARGRLQNPSIRGRMAFAAEFLAIKESEPAAAHAHVLRTFERIKNDPKGFAFHFERYRPPARPATTRAATRPSEQGFVDVAARLAVQNAGDYEFRRLLDEFNSYAATWYDRTDPELLKSVMHHPDFRHDDQMRGGSSISLPQGPYADLRSNAEEFLQNYQMFDDGHLTAASEPAKLRPWRLIKFYDPKRYILSQTLPFAFGALLLACSLILQFRFVDFSKRKSPVWRGAAMPKRSVSGFARWPTVWDPRTPPSAAAASDAWQYGSGRLILWVPLAVLAALFVELVLDVPGLRAEWWVNVPLLSATAVLIAVIWSSLLRMSAWRFDRLGIGRASRECRAKILRPFLLGALTLLGATAWMIGYSVVVLPLGPAEHVREFVQIAVSVITSALLALLAWKLSRRPLPSQTPWKMTSDEEEALNYGKSGLLDSVLPNLDDNMRKALLLAIVPLASVIESLLG